jgi:hypothetical protein
MSSTHFTAWFALLMIAGAFFLIFGAALFAYLVIRGKRNPPRGFDVMPPPVNNRHKPTCSPQPAPEPNPVANHGFPATFKFPI